MCIARQADTLYSCWAAIKLRQFNSIVVELTQCLAPFFLSLFLLPAQWATLLKCTTSSPKKYAMHKVHCSKCLCLWAIGLCAFYARNQEKWKCIFMTFFLFSFARLSAAFWLGLPSSLPLSGQVCLFRYILCCPFVAMRRRRRRPVGSLCV